jgi:hypothetical protein
MFYNFCINFFIEFTVIEKDSIHFFEFADYEIALMYDRLHSNTTAYKHLIDCYELSELPVIDHLLKLLYLVLKRDH